AKIANFKTYQPEISAEPVFETSGTTVLFLAKHLVPLLLFNRLYFFSKVTDLLRSTKRNNDLLLYFLHVWGKFKQKKLSD
ncbi:hypothetical protein, partial [Phocaeicola vulgatus]|uniref:hypothetical protein n=1 Tax=Phocaeicola vulgatus TaxID=821 RepID=UPI001C711A22